MIKLDDDLIATGNLFDHIDPFEFAVSAMRLPSAGTCPEAALAFQVAPNLEDALRVSCEILASTPAHLKVCYERRREFGAIVVRSDFVQGRLLDCISLGILTVLTRLAEAMVSRVRSEAVIELTARPTRQTRAALEELRCSVSLEAAENRLMLPAELLDLPNARHDPSLWKLARNGAGQQRGSRASMQLGRRVSLEIRHALAEQKRMPRLKQFADELQMSERTIVRELTAEGTSYRAIADAERKRQAMNLLSDPSINLLEIAELLGFANASSFWRTFRRWTGDTPAGYRRSRRSAPLQPLQARS